MKKVEQLQKLSIDKESVDKSQLDIMCECIIAEGVGNVDASQMGVTIDTEATIELVDNGSSEPNTTKRGTN